MATTGFASDNTARFGLSSLSTHATGVSRCRRRRVATTKAFGASAAICRGKGANLDTPPKPGLPAGSAHNCPRVATIGRGAAAAATRITGLDPVSPRRGEQAVRFQGKYRGPLHTVSRLVNGKSVQCETLCSWLFVRAGYLHSPGGPQKPHQRHRFPQVYEAPLRTAPLD